MAKERKIVWKDDGITKTAKGSGFTITGSDDCLMIIFHGYDGDIVVTPKNLVIIT